MKKYIIAFLITSFLFSCTKKENIEITPLIMTKEITGSLIQNITEGCYWESFILDSLLVLNSTCDTNIFHIYNKFDLRFLGKAGTKGQAPFEFESPYLYKTATTTKEKNSMLFFDTNLGQNKNVDFKKILAGERIDNCVESEQIDRNLILCHELLVLDENRVAGTSMNESKGIYFIYNKKDKEKKWVDQHPKTKLDNKYHVDLYYATLGANPSKNTIVYASRHFDEILFFNTDGELKKEYYFSELIQPEISTQFTGISNDAPIYSLKMYCTNEHCYVLRVNQTTYQLNDNTVLPIQILAFDWEGTLIDIYKLNFYPNTFCVDEETQTIYLIQPNQEESDFTVNIIKAPL
jgi:hypothetical protein